MKIDIQQYQWNIGDKYQIYINGQYAYDGSVKPLRVFDEIRLFEKSGRRLTCEIKKQWDFFRAAYNLRTKTGKILHFRTRQFWKGHYYCHAGLDLYDIFAHKGRKYSVFKNGVQIAWWDKSAFTWFDGDYYSIITDYDSDYELIISFCLIIDNAFSKNVGSASITIDFGRMMQAKEFDPEWRPKES